MRTSLFALLPLLGVSIGAADDDLSRLVDRLFDRSPAIRAEARAALAGREDATVAAILDRIEARQPAAEGVRIHDVRDLLSEGKRGEFVAARIRELGGEGSEFDEERGTLVVRGTETEQARIAAALEALRTSLSRLVRMQFRVVRQAPEAERPPERIAPEDLEGMLGHPGTLVVASPSLVCRNGDEASIRVLSQVSFVSDFDLEPAAGGILADPVVSTAEEGLSITVRPAIEGGTIRLAVRAEFAELDRPLPKFRFEVPGGSPLEIQVPSGRTSRTTKVLSCERGFLSVVELGDGLRLLVEASEAAEPR